MLSLHEGMTLHPISVAVTFVICAILCGFTMVSMIKQRKKGLAGFMFLSLIVMLACAYVSSTVTA
ncbi:hypothetical protein [Tumebacillus permanentifrigoris]|uniref:Uncharacterized protein n=1 Tax=Tumebacillus permanentifrigoris TaxID=378543 RepID=A0A316D5E1_9BACL|nr:hypothetical protein [Tumebacillus permanentifrigoris]PWK07866.1 hypothetical protein C7459_11625 [Tumebacillus permanentifrigoris]